MRIGNPTDGIGWYALMYSIILGESPKQAMLYFDCCPEDKPYNWKKEVKSTRVLQVAREFPEYSTREIAIAAECSASLVEYVISNARAGIIYDESAVGDVECKILKMNEMNPCYKFSDIASKLMISRKMVRKTILKHLPSKFLRNKQSETIP